MAAFERNSHQIDVAHAFKGIIGAADLVGVAFSHVDEMGDEIAADFRRIDEMRHAEALAPGFLFRIEIDANDHVGADEAKAWMTFNPMPPSPNTMHLAPGSTFAVLITAPMPVVTPQPT